jgi:hypothetical protein
MLVVRAPNIAVIARDSKNALQTIRAIVFIVPDSVNGGEMSAVAADVLGLGKGLHPCFFVVVPKEMAVSWDSTKEKVPAPAAVVAASATPAWSKLAADAAQMRHLAYQLALSTPSLTFCVTPPTDTTAARAGSASSSR